MFKCVLAGKISQNKRATKLHPLYYITTQITTFIQITAATVNDVNAMDYFPDKNGAYYIGLTPYSLDRF